jgi:hypothetical protein
MTQPNQKHNLARSTKNMGIRMLKKRWARPLAYGIATLTAMILAVLGVANDLAVEQQSDSTLTILMAATALGMLVSIYGLYVQRHGIRAHILRHAEVHKRLTRRKRPERHPKPVSTYPRPRDTVAGAALAFKPVRGSRI